MEENKNLQPEPEISPEEKLDQLLAEFLATPDMELPSVPENTEPLQEPAAADMPAIQEERPLPEESAPEEAEAEEENTAQAVSEPENSPTDVAENADAVDILPGLEWDVESAALSRLLEQHTVLADTPAEEATPAEEPIEEVTVAEEANQAPASAAQTAEAEAIPEESAPEAESTAEEDTPEAESDGQILPLVDITIGESLSAPSESEEIGVDEQALEAAGLTTVEPEAQGAEGDTQEEITSSIPILISTHTQEQPESKEPESMSEPIDDQLSEEEALEEEDPSRNPTKKRPRKKGTYGLFSLPHIAATALWLAIILFIGVGLGNILWEYAADMLAFGREDNTVTITIYADEDLDDIAQKLESMGLIKYQGLFKLYAGLADAMEDINPGTYKLKTSFDYNALVDAMSGYGARVTTKVVIPEGYTCQQIFQLLENSGVCSKAELEAAAADADLGEYWFLDGVERGTANCLEGYLFPDTYQFYYDHDPVKALQKMLDNFNKRFNDTMKANLITLNETLSEMMRKNGLSEDYIAQHQLTVRDVVIVASMIEKETANTAEGYTIASVIYNRLTNPNAYPYLQIDATLVYITGNHNLTAEDLAFDSPYNTYLYSGLVPGPISNPSRASLDAALDPLSTTYHYYALNPETGVHKFSETLAEHDAFLESLKKKED